MRQIVKVLRTENKEHTVSMKCDIPIQLQPVALIAKCGGSGG